jgi:carbon storage regulator
MLVLSRKRGESIIIGDNIRLTVVEMDRQKVRLGIEAPKDVPIARMEILDAGKNSTTVPPASTRK